ncbi:MAG: S9 family peptidase [Acidobacteriia bacterium]|nr:S9 family peptidase [Terriglobia bacterium]
MRVAVLCTVILACAFAQETKSWTPAYQMKFRGVAEVTPSPDGKRVLWTETVAITEGEKSENLTHVFVALADGAGRLQLTRGEKSATSPRFSPDGRWVFFASERSGKRNLFRIRLEGGEAERLTDWTGTLGNYAVSNDGLQIAFAGAEEDKELEKRKKEKLDYKVVDDKPRNQSLWVMSLADALPGKPKRVVQEEYHIGAFDWSPDSTRIAYEHRPRPDADEGRLADVAEVEVATGKTAEIAASTATETGPRYSPDSKYLLIERSPLKARGMDGSRIVLLPRGGGAARELPASFDENPTVIGWAPDSGSILFSEMKRTRMVYYRMPVDGPVSVLFAPTRGTAGLARVNATNTHLGLSLQAPEEPVEAYVMALRGAGPGTGKPLRVSEANTGIEKPPMGKTELIQWKGKDGLVVEGLLTYPAAYEKGKRVPLILNIHGGPSGLFNESFTGASGLYPIASWAAKGYAVLRPNPRGSSGYGVKFRQRVIQDWGGLDYQDLMTGVDHVIGMGVADAERLAVMGWSYGGYMTAWTVTQTNRFKAAVIGAGITNHVSMYGTQDIPSVYEDYFGGTPWDLPQVYARSSPIQFIARAKTPTLLLHGENDNRVPPTQAHEYYRALKRQGVETRMILYPRQPHGPTEPKFVQHVMEQHLEWAEKFLR